MNTEFTKQFFIDSSKEWMKNKRRTKSGYYIYTCNHTYKYGKLCGRDCYKDNDLCRQHYFINQKQKSTDYTDLK